MCQLSAHYSWCLVAIKKKLNEQAGGRNSVKQINSLIIHMLSQAELKLGTVILCEDPPLSIYVWLDYVTGLSNIVFK